MGDPLSAVDPWHGPAYERLSDPQFRWGMRVLDRVALRGGESALDAGCGSGRLTEKLLERLPRGRVLAVDRSPSMLEVAREKLAPRFGDRVRLLEADLQTFVAPEPVDLVFSTATFHWILDHDHLFRNLHASLVPGGRLEAQCGGGPNVARLHARAKEMMDGEFARWFEGFEPPWRFHDAESSARRLRDAGFADVETSLEAQPAVFDDPGTFREFIEKVVLHPYLAQLPADRRDGFLDVLVERAGGDDPPWTLDYWRLNLRGRKPGA